MVMEFLSTLSQFLASHQGVIGTVVAVLFAVAKFFSTEKAPLIIGKVQAAFDYAAKLVSQVGTLLQKVADLLSDSIKSDGVLGKK